MFKLLLKFMFSRRALEELYDRRKALNPSEQNRTPLTMLACGVLFVTIMSFLMSMSWTRKDVASFLKNQPGIVTLDKATWSWSNPIQSQCQEVNECLQSIGKAENTTGNITDLPALIKPSSEHLWTTHLKTEAEFKLGQLLFADRRVTFVLPTFRYYKAYVLMNGKLVGLFRDSDRIAIGFDRAIDQKIESPKFVFEIVLQTSSDAKSFLPEFFSELHPFEQQISFMPSHVFSSYKQYRAAESAGRGDFIGYIARIVMAVFVLALFLLVDGSPETLGLGLFMGFEAFAMSMSFEWIRFPYSDMVRHYCYQMGDFFRLYFFLQLARVIDKKIFLWLLVTTALSIPYGYLRQFQFELNIDWPSKIPNYRDMIIGVIGTSVCIRSAYYLWNKQLPWRVIALLVAGLASFEHCFQPLGSEIPFIAESIVFQRYIDIFQPLSAYLMAFSAFINISTMENRVKALSKIEAKHREIEHEMELGQTVQQAFLHLPELPGHIDFETHHEAMLYVSGDTYFVDWDTEKEVLTFLINDVTGHGVQAALKASGVNVIANTLWLRKEHKSDGPKILEYASLVDKFFKRMNQNPDILAMGAVQVDFQKGLASFYRVNFPFPVVIEPKTDHIDNESSRREDNWRVKLLATTNETLVHYQLKQGSFIIIFSDGFIDTSRSTNEFLHYLRKHLGRADLNLTCEKIKELIIGCNIKASNIDDRTMNIFQWTLDENARKSILEERKIHSIPSKSSRAA